MQNVITSVLLKEKKCSAEVKNLLWKLFFIYNCVELSQLYELKDYLRYHVPTKPDIRIGFFCEITLHLYCYFSRFPLLLSRFHLHYDNQFYL